MKFKETDVINFVSYSGWDEVDYFSFQLYDVEITKEFGDLKIGDKYDFMIVSYSAGVIEFWNDKNLVKHIPIKIVVDETRT